MRAIGNGGIVASIVAGCGDHCIAASRHPLLRRNLSIGGGSCWYCGLAGGGGDIVVSWPIAYLASAWHCGICLAVPVRRAR